MTDKPIIFSAPMIRALLDGRKSMTRRVLKEQRHVSIPAFAGGRWQWLGHSGAILGDIRIPYAPGVRLWVREAFYRCEECAYLNHAEGANSAGIRDRKCCANCDELLPRAKLSPIHMPRWASRLTLTVTDVRVQRVQDISAEDSVAEGVQCGTCEAMNQSACHGRGCFASIDAFRDLWNSIHGPGAWAANAWVAVISFTVDRRNIDAVAG